MDVIRTREDVGVHPIDHTVVGCRSTHTQNVTMWIIAVSFLDVAGLSGSVERGPSEFPTIDVLHGELVVPRVFVRVRFPERGSWLP